MSDIEMKDRESDIEMKDQESDIEMKEVSNKKMKTIGTKKQVYEGRAKRTSGGLTKDRIIKNKRGKYVSKAKSELGKLRYKENGLKPKTAEEMEKMRSQRFKN